MIDFHQYVKLVTSVLLYAIVRQANNRIPAVSRMISGSNAYYFVSFVVGDDFLLHVGW